jgi:nucleotide-binding universal stress UspA family protein
VASGRIVEEDVADRRQETGGGRNEMGPSTALGIVVGYDGSWSSRQALRWASQEASMRKSGLHLVYVWEPPPMVTSWAPADVKAREYDSEPLLDDAVAVARGLAPHVTVTSSAAEGAVAAELVRLSGNADTMVLGSHGHRRRLLTDLGSTAWQLAGHAACPVVVVRDVALPMGPGRIVVGVDGSPGADAALRYAFGAAERRESAVVAVHAWHLENLQAYYVVMQSEEERAADDRARLPELDAWVQPWRRQHPRVTVRLVSHRWHPVETLLEQARDAQLLVVGRRGRHGFPGLALGSVGFDLLRSASCPLAIVPPDGI